MRRWSLLALLALALPGCTDAPRAARAPIIDGFPGSSGVAPGAVALVWSRSVLEASGCSGTLIAPRVVVTAAHCVVQGTELATPDEMLVVAGANVRDTADAEHRYGVVAIHPHPDYPRDQIEDPVTGLGRDDDIAVLELDRDVTTTAVVRVLDLARADARVLPMSWVRIAGYGLTGDPLPAGTLFFADTVVAARSSHEILVGGPERPDTCYGDSGGPTYVTLDGVATLVGVTSRGTYSATVPCGDGSIQTYAPRYIDWIAEVTAGAYALDGGPLPDAGPAAPLPRRCSADPGVTPAPTALPGLLVALSLRRARRRATPRATRA